ncbi:MULTISPECIES: asparagine synthetase A [Microbacterium]|uniref:Asparagine--tRNA ligase n=1 Tax=Microbacterium oxydans TaxID=82380 RepID=A0A3Q9J5V2_9MICO|nr:MULTISPECIES: asparagine synthetase A [Microbacterium]AZS39078.1 Asparagine--tRNA ligase [Microbacterium oxydans]KKX99182.1 hypothetical protein AAY78_03235 [Microbacterium sp. Ag1]
MSSNQKTAWENPDRYLEVLDSPLHRLIVTVQDSLTYGTSNYWRSRGVKAAHLPITTGAISSPMGRGSDSSPVHIELFGVPTYLADSMQFGLEYALRLAEKGAYYVMPSFRGEDADSTHLCQFYHSEVEIPGSLDDVVQEAEHYLKAITRQVLEDAGPEIEAYCGTISHLEHLVTQDRFPRVTFDEAARLLDDSKIIQHDGWRDLTRSGEHDLIRLHGGPVWLTHWDSLSVPFYQATTQMQEVALNADLLFGLGEVLGCGERHQGASTLRESMRRHEVDEGPYEWYVRMKEEAPLQTSGFGMGTERFIAWVLQMEDVRDVQLMPRANGRQLVP